MSAAHEGRGDLAHRNLSARVRRLGHFSEYRIGRCLRPPTNVVADHSGCPA
jgi:hypothetical protein